MFLLSCLLVFYVYVSLLIFTLEKPIFFLDHIPPLFLSFNKNFLGTTLKPLTMLDVLVEFAPTHGDCILVQRYWKMNSELGSHMPFGVQGLLVQWWVVSSWVYGLGSAGKCNQGSCLKSLCLGLERLHNHKAFVLCVADPG